MKKLFVLFLLSFLILSLNSCTKFDENNTDNIYAQIVLKDNRKINLKLEYQAAPRTVKNFIKLVKEGFYNNKIFHRIIDNFMIQGGGYELDNNLPINHSTDAIYGEFSSNGFDNPLKHDLGVISMARTTNPNSASCQFFICSAPNDKISYLDGQYAAFGKTYEDKSNQVILELSKVKTIRYNAYLEDYPEVPIIIKKIKLANSAF